MNFDDPAQMAKDLLKGAKFGGELGVEDAPRATAALTELLKDISRIMLEEVDKPEPNPDNVKEAWDAGLQSFLDTWTITLAKM